MASSHKKPSRSPHLLCCFTHSSSPSWSSPSPPTDEKLKDDVVLSSSGKMPGGWKSMFYILGNETFERLATIGLIANLMVYLQTQLHLELVPATNLLNIWSGVTNVAPLVGAFISDSYAGRFRTIAFASFASLLGMITLTLSAWIPQLHPPKCTPQQQQLGKCIGTTAAQLSVFLAGLGLLTIGTGGIRPCSIPFGVDQFDSTTNEGRKGINSFFNWYYTTFTVVLILALTLVVYIQDSVSWAIGFGVPTGPMVCSISLFFLGSRVYVYVKPEGSVLSGIARVFVAAHRKRKLKLPKVTLAGGGEVAVRGGLYYDPPLKGIVNVTKLPLTQDFRSLNKAALTIAGEVDSDGVPKNKWRLCSIQQIEEVKCLLRIVPIWAAGIINLTSIFQQSTFTVAQALKMNRHLGPNFQIPAGSLSVVSMLTIGIWVPIYDRIVVPNLRKITNHEGGLTLLQRIGIGNVFSILSMLVAGLMENERRNSANKSHSLQNVVAPMSVTWLFPQLILMGFAEAFSIIGMIEFYNRQFPEKMRSIANSFFSITLAGASYLSSFIVTTVHDTTGGHGRPDWLTKDINHGRVDYFYYVIAGLGCINFIYFLVVARRYCYKAEFVRTEEDLELNFAGNKL